MEAPPLAPLHLSNESDCLTYIDGINAALGRAANAQAYYPAEPKLANAGVKSLVYVDLADLPDQQPGSENHNYLLTIQSLGVNKLAYALVNESPAFADALMVAIGTLLMAQGQTDVIPRDHLTD
ncbi:hypothetical protein [Fibrella aquatilis]|uniref:Uncharacterized protein n=1 Tax=Fibrella aquatilis TaxID=2817059 RepID=A0A939G5E0_9BACT|nr:hypothetical protein [Fibrella aquatilis]MBO0930336.1 hypothetical protein [Fibrella aquatilis]